MSADRQTCATPSVQQADTLPAQAPRLQTLLNSFSGELRAYQLGSPADAIHPNSWDGLLGEATVLPELAEPCQRLIERRLGYLPPHSKIASEAAFLRALLHLYQAGQLSDEDFNAQTDHCIGTLRNLDMQVPMRGEMPLADALPWYEHYLPAYGPQARARLTRFLKEPPALEHSLVVELWLRQILAQDSYVLPDEETAIDRKAVMLVTYRKILALHGRQAANDSPLPY